MFSNQGSQKIRVVYCCVLLCIGSIIFAQSFPTGGVTPPGLQTSNILENDTSRVYYFHIDAVKDLTEFSDTLLNEFHLYSPIEKGQLYGQSLGNLGSSSRPLMYAANGNRKGLEFGYHQYDPYLMDRQQFQLIQSEKAVSHLFFSSFGQEDFIVKAQFSRPFANNVQLTLDYTRVLQQGFYNSQNTRLTNIGMSISKKMDNRQWIFTAISNADNEAHNGGVSDPTQFDNPAIFPEFRTNISTSLSEAQTRNATQEYALNNYFNLKRFEGVQFRHEIAFERGSFKYSDENSGNEDFYGDFLNDDRGVRSFLEYGSLKNSLWASLTVNKFDLDLGFNYSFYNINLEARRERIHDFGLLANVDFGISDKFKLAGDAYLGIGENVGEYTMNGFLEGKLVKGISLKAFGTLQRYRPSILKQESYINQQAIWQNDFSQPLENQVGGTLDLSKFGLAVTVKQLVQTNPIFINETQRPEQFDGSIFITQLLFNTNHKLLFLNLKNQVGLQNLSENIWQLPSFISEHEVYLEGFIFKKRMFTRFGGRLRTAEAYTVAGFSPVHGLFHQREGAVEPFFWQADAYVSFKIDRFRAFIRAENLSQAFTGDVFYLTNLYPVFDFKIRLGVAWTLYH
jgi:hypothetical protein